MEIIATTKITNRDGIKAIKNGQKLNKYADIPTPKKPSWLKVKAEFNPNFHKVKEQVHSKQLYTVCEEAHCPNISECWSAGTATFMLMGSVCTRACKFCSVDTGNPNGWLDKDEPLNTAKAVEIMNLKYVVLTSVNRDDLPDGGAQHFANTVKLIKDLNSDSPLKIYQTLVQQYLSYETPYRGLLVYHGLGTGKTCSSISVCEEMRNYYQQIGSKKKIMIVASPKVQENYRLQLFDKTKLKEINGLWNLKACTGNKFIKDAIRTNYYSGDSPDDAVLMSLDI